MGSNEQNLDDLNSHSCNAASERERNTEPWTLVERYVENYPDDWRLVFRWGDEIREVSVPEEAWRAFDS